MKTCTKCHNLKPLSMFHKDKRSKDGVRSKCKKCVAVWCKANRKKISEKEKEWLKINRDLFNQKKREKYAMNDVYRQSRLQLNKQWAAKNHFYTLQRCQEWEKNNKPLRKAIRQQWQKNNIERMNHYRMMRHAAKIKRTPIWLDEKAKTLIVDFYEQAKNKTKLTGQIWSVDHIIPLRGERVSGLHVPNNLQVITLSENAQKGNKFDIDKEWRT